MHNPIRRLHLRQRVDQQHRWSAQPVAETVFALVHYATFDAVVDLVRSQRDMKLLVVILYSAGVLNLVARIYAYK